MLTLHCYQESFPSLQNLWILQKPVQGVNYIRYSILKKSRQKKQIFKPILTYANPLWLYAAKLIPRNYTLSKIYLYDVSASWFVWKTVIRRDLGI